MSPIEEQPYSHPVDILSARRWQSALFTTYAFSISFFESVVFRALTQRLSCDEICVIVDTDGYGSSLMERGATRVGRDYTLIPVLAPGVFHPKCTYLSGPDGDLLLVGSGNLTFGGYGRNIEVLEVLQPNKHRQAFLDFADFLESLISKSRSQVAKPDCVKNFIKRARTAALSVPSEGSDVSVRLLHSCEESIAPATRGVCGSPRRCEKHNGPISFSRFQRVGNSEARRHYKVLHNPHRTSTGPRPDLYISVPWAER